MIRCLAVCLLCLSIDDRTYALDTDLPSQAIAVLEKHCYACHGQNGSAEGGVSRILDVEDLIKNEIVTPGQASASRVVIRMTSHDDPMPPQEQTQRPSRDEITLVRTWIEAGAATPRHSTANDRPQVRLSDVLSTIDTHLNGLSEEDWRYQRYFTLTHLHNLSSVRDSDFRLYRAALSKLINSLSWKPRILLPLGVDPQQTVFAIDIRDVDWDQNSHWQRVIEQYPYALKHDLYPADERTGELAKEIYRKTRTDIPMIRADWFIATASRPPLYHDLLQIPHTAQQLEAMLKVDTRYNFRRDRLARAGFVRSGVSAQNRLVERHDGLHGAYWVSYDFKPNRQQGNLFLHSLGPHFEGNPFNQHAFRHDGGEIIFHLPNGLQAYMLVDEQGNRIDSGPLDVVRDKKEVSGSPSIVNGLSCMACHRHGMIDEFTDTVRTGTALQGEPLRKVKRLHVVHEEMQRLLADDNRRFRSSLDAAIGPYLRLDGDQRDITAFAEPISKIAKWYRLQDLGAEELAAELYLESAEEIKSAIQFNPNLRRFGLGPIAHGNTIKRSGWETAQGTSVFQDVAFELERGTPIFFTSTTKR